MRHAIKEWDGEIDSRPQNRAQAAEPLNHIFFGLRDNFDSGRDRHDDDHGQNDQCEVPA